MRPPMLRILVACTVVWAAALLPGYGLGGGVKIATVDMERAIKAHPETESSLSILEERRDEFQAEQEEMRAELKKLREDAQQLIEESENKALSETAREEKQKLADEKVRELRELDQKRQEMRSQRQRELSDQNVRMLRRVVGKVREIVQAYARKKGFTLVLDSSAVAVSGVEAVVYSEDKADITDAVVEQIEKETR